MSSNRINSQKNQAPGICTGRILLVKQAKIEIVLLFLYFPFRRKSGGLHPRNPKTFFLLLGFFYLKLPMLLKNKTMQWNMCSEDVPAPSHGSITSPAQEGLVKLWQPILIQEGLNIFAVIFGPVPTFEPCYSDHFKHTESTFLAMALWSP